MSFNAVSMSQLSEIISGTLSVPTASYALFAEGIAGLIESASHANFSDTARSSSYAATASYFTKPMVIAFACSDETTTLQSGSALGTFYMPYNLTASDIKASLTLSGSSSSYVNILKNGITVFSTPMIISASYYTASNIPSTTDFNSGDRIQIDLNLAGTGSAGLKIYILGN
jgi:hypothetical protein